MLDAGRVPGVRSRILNPLGSLVGKNFPGSWVVNFTNMSAGTLLIIIFFLLVLNSGRNRR